MSLRERTAEYFFVYLLFIPEHFYYYARGHLQKQK